MRVSVKVKRLGPSLTATVIPQLRAAAHYATDRAIETAKVQTRATVRGVGLGGLANAIGATSSLKKRQTRGSAYGVIYARGGIDSRANQALMAYTHGASIYPTNGRKWLAFPTKAAGRLARLPLPRVGARRFANVKNKPAYAGVKLRFVQFSSTRAALVLDDAVVSGKTGRAKPFGKRLGRGATRHKFVIMFVLIKFTRRAQRFDQDAIVAQAGATIGQHVAEYQARQQ
jgi:hypothetical protein